MNTIMEIDAAELALIAGGGPRPGQSLLDYLLENDIPVNTYSAPEGF